MQNSRLMSLAGDRTNLRAGNPQAAVAHLYLHLRVPALLTAWLPSYGKVYGYPPLYLATQYETANTLDVLMMATQRVVVK